MRYLVVELVLEYLKYVVPRGNKFTAQPNPCDIVSVVVVKMVSVAGAKEAELQGSSSVVRPNVNLDAVEAGETPQRQT
jgi:hypothetical protein